MSNPAPSVSTPALLAQVIGLGEIVLMRPAQARADAVTAASASVKARHEQESAQPRRTHFAMMLLEALDHVMRARRVADEDALAWEMIAAALLPCVKIDAHRALIDERDARAEGERIERDIERDLMSTTQR